MDVTMFPKNLRRLRVRQGLTQKMLGEKLSFSEKTVSKWECGAAIPSMETLFALCELLQTNVEALFSSGNRYFLGIDGGGTKTALMLTDAQGNPLRTHLADACNPVDIGIEAAQNVLKKAIFEICRDVPFSCVTMFAGIAGGTSGDMQERLHRFFEEFDFYDFENDSDNLNIIAAGLGHRDGITVILGTGFCVYTQKERRHHRICGWGYLIDEAGSGYNLGRDALHAYFSAYDGTGESTLLTEEIDRLFDGGVKGLIPHIYENGKKAVAAFAPALFSAETRGDAVAAEILARNVREVARVISVAAREFEGAEQIPVVLAGGLTRERAMVTCLQEQLAQNPVYQMSVLNTEPVRGAVMLAQAIGGNSNA